MFIYTMIPCSLLYPLTHTEDRQRYHGSHRPTNDFLQRDTVEIIFVLA